MSKGNKDTKKIEIMKTYKGIALKFKGSKRSNYLSFGDLIQDLTTENLIKVLSKVEKFSEQMLVMTEIELRNELNENDYFDLLETCNGF